MFNQLVPVIPRTCYGYKYINIFVYMKNNGERIAEIIYSFCKSKADFARKVGEKPQTISNWVARDNGMNVLNKIIEVFPEINMDWLMTGEGEMLKKTIGGITPSADKNTRPRIPYDAAAGTLTETIDGVTSYQCEQLPIISAFPKYDFTIRITGKSMEPEYYAGDEVACLRVNEESFLQWGRVHVLDTTQGVIIKRIYDDGDKIRCKSYNPEYPDFSIPKGDIRSYNLVVGSLRL